MNNINWKTIDEIDKSGLILTLCQDSTGIYNQLMTVIIDNKAKDLNRKQFYQNGVLGCSYRVSPDKIKAVLYLDEVCPKEIINNFCDT